MALGGLDRRGRQNGDMDLKTVRGGKPALARAQRQNRRGRQNPAVTRSLRWRDLGASAKSGRSVARAGGGESGVCGTVQTALFVARDLVHDLQPLPGLWRVWFCQLGSCAAG